MDFSSSVTVLTVATIVMIVVGVLASVLWFIFRLDREQEKDERER